VYATAQKWLPRCSIHRGSDFRGVAYTAEVTSALYATPQKWKSYFPLITDLCYHNLTSSTSLIVSMWLPRRMQHHGSHFRGVCYTAEVTSALYATPRKWLPRCSIHRGSFVIKTIKLLQCMLQRGSDFCGVAYSAEVTSALYATPRKFRKISFQPQRMANRQKVISSIC